MINIAVLTFLDLLKLMTKPSSIIISLAVVGLSTFVLALSDTNLYCDMKK